MWQHHYVVHQMRMEQLRAEADRERRWHLEDIENGRVRVPSIPGPVRAAAARALAAVSRGTAAGARRLDGRLAGPVPGRALRDA